jgi:hypothetical protein
MKVTLLMSFAASQQAHQKRDLHLNQAKKTVMKQLKPLKVPKSFS